MRSLRTTLAIIIAAILLVACSTAAPAATPTATLQSTSAATPTLTSTNAPHDIFKYWNTFEDVTDLAASGITSDNAQVKITVENVDYFGGKKALEVSGTLPGAQWSALLVKFSIKQLVGENNLDISNKTVGFSLFIPKDSPFNTDNMMIELSKGDKKVQLPARSILPSDVATKGVWLDYLAELSKIYQDQSWGWTNGTNAEAREVFQHCETFSIGGVRYTEGTTADTKFYLDDLNWIGFDPFNVPVENNIDSLRKFTEDKHFKIGLWAGGGGFLSSDQNDPWKAYMVAQEGTIVAVTDAPLKSNDPYYDHDYDPAYEAWKEQQFKYAYGNHMTTMGYAKGGCYAHCVPQWIKDLAFPDETTAYLLFRVEDDVQYTQGKNPVWFLFNEPILDVGNSGGSMGLRSRQGRLDWNEYSPWAADPADTTLMKAAFIKAGEADPNATLMINDYGNEEMGNEKADYLFDLVSGLKQEGIPIDGVGFQLHSEVKPDGNITSSIYQAKPVGDMETYLKKIDLNVKRYAGIGMKVAFSEVEFYVRVDDIDLTTSAGRVEYEKRLQWQAKYYAGLLKIALENENVILFHMWGVSDRYLGASNEPGYGDPYLFDKHYQPKPAYDAMLDLLKQY